MASIITLVQGEPITFNFLGLPEEQKIAAITNNTNKRKASEAALDEKPDASNTQTETSIKSLDDDTAMQDESKSTLKVEKHVYFEPRSLSDINICYQNCVFHCHTYPLMLQCKYFETLLTGDTKAKCIEIPALISAIYPNPISVDGFQNFLTLVHDPLTKVAWVIGNIGFLSHYFQAERLETRLQDMATISQKTDEWLWQLVVAEHYNWPITIRKLLHTRVVDNLKYYMKKFHEHENHWNRLPVTTQRNIYAHYIHKIGEKIGMPVQQLTS